MSPSAKTIKRGVDLFNLDNIMRTADALKGGSHIFVKQDEGNKKEKKLLYVSASTWSEGVVVEQTLGAVAAQSGKVSAVVLGLPEQAMADKTTLRGGCADSAPSNNTYNDEMAAVEAKWLGAPCELHILHLILLRAHFAAFGEQIRRAPRARLTGALAWRARCAWASWCRT